MILVENPENPSLETRGIIGGLEELRLREDTRVLPPQAVRLNILRYRDLRGRTERESYD